MKKSKGILVLLVLVSLVLASCASPATQAPGEGTAMEGLPDLGGRVVTVAVENAYPPFNYIDEATNEAIGWDYDAVREICARINCTPDFREASWDGIFLAMNAGEYDWLADGVTVTPERAEIVDFSIPYVIVRQVLLVRENETASLEEIKADSSRIVGTQLGTTNEIVALQHFPADRISSFEDFGATVQATLTGDIDGVVIDNVSADGYMDAEPGQLKILGELASDEELAFAFPPGSDLLEPVNAALESMRADGKLEEINLQWGLSFEQ